MGHIPLSHVDMTTDTTQPISLIVLGGGQRGVVYAHYTTQGGRATIAAVADPREARRKLFARRYQCVPIPLPI